MGVKERSVKRLIKVCSLSERSREDGYQSVRTHKHFHSHSHTNTFTHTHTLSFTHMHEVQVEVGRE